MKKILHFSFIFFLLIYYGNICCAQNKGNNSFADDQQRSVFNEKSPLVVQQAENTGFSHSKDISTCLAKDSKDSGTLAPVLKTNSTSSRLHQGLKKEVGKMLGADISFLPQLEASGIHFSDKGKEKDAIDILKDHGFNYVRLRIFNEPANDSGYSPYKGFCDLQHTLQMAKRIRNAGLKFLLDFHYSDTWADPGKQFKPAAWKALEFGLLTKALHDYTRDVMLALKQQNTLPDMVQTGNEINHGMLWPDGRMNNPDNLSVLLKAGINAVKEIAPSTIIMLHIALGGHHDESVFFIDNMLERGVHFDVIGQSYYPKWHGTPGDLKNNLNLLSKKYMQDIIVVEYSQLKKEVNDIGFDLPGNKGKGTCIWEPLSTWEAIFDKEGKSNALIREYDEISRKYMH